MVLQPCKPSHLLCVVIWCDSRTHSFVMSVGPRFANSIQPGGHSCTSQSTSLNRVLKSVQSTAIAASACPQARSCRIPAPFGHRHDGDAVHQGGAAVSSCRLCLIACNSRQFDELGVRA